MDYRNRLNHYLDWAKAQGLRPVDEMMDGPLTLFYDGLPQDCRHFLVCQGVTWTMEGVYLAAVDWERRQAAVRLALSPAPIPVLPYTPLVRFGQHPGLLPNLAHLP